jgi:hypothetical protein
VSDDQLTGVRRALRVLRDSCGLDEMPPPDVVARRDVMRFRAIADALLLLLPSGPVEGQHAVEDIAPYLRDQGSLDGPTWTWVWRYVRVLTTSGDQHPIRLDTDGFQWMTVGEAEIMAAELLSAAARARAANQKPRCDLCQAPTDETSMSLHQSKNHKPDPTPEPLR